MFPTIKRMKLTKSAKKIIEALQNVGSPRFLGPLPTLSAIDTVRLPQLHVLSVQNELSRAPITLTVLSECELLEEIVTAARKNTPENILSAILESEPLIAV